MKNITMICFFQMSVSACMLTPRPIVAPATASVPTASVQPVVRSEKPATGKPVGPASPRQVGELTAEEFDIFLATQKEEKRLVEIVSKKFEAWQAKDVDAQALKAVQDRFVKWVKTSVAKTHKRSSECWSRVVTTEADQKVCGERLWDLSQDGHILVR